MPPKKPKKILDKIKLQNWLKAKGHDAEKVGKLKLDKADLHKTMFELHGLTP